MSIRVCTTGHRPIKDPVPLIEKSRASCPSVRFPPSSIYQVINITGLIKLYDCMFSPEDGLRSRQGVKPSLKLILFPMSIISQSAKTAQKPLMMAPINLIKRQ